MINDWLLDPQLKQDYLNACNIAIETSDFDAFKKHPAVNCIVENSTQEWADKIRAGTGFTFNNMSPNEVRYNYTWLIMAHVFDWHPFLKISEIGAGYGGMAECIFNYNLIDYPIRYYIYDLPEAVQLQQAYLKHSIQDVFYDNCEWLNFDLNIPKHDICIAWCSWSELSTEAKIKYIINVMKQAKHIFIASNWDFNGDVALLQKYFDNVKILDNPYFGKIIYT